jgi:hypothetical protein
MPAEVRTSAVSAQLTLVRTKVSIGIQTDENLPAFEALHGPATQEGPEEDLIEF